MTILLQDGFMKVDVPMRDSPVAESMLAENPGCCRMPLSMTQKTVAKRMLQSARDIPQFSVSMELNADHRILDGAEVARFLRTLQESVEGVESWGEAKLGGQQSTLQYAKTQNRL